ncbi:MAG: divergent polysaccharide deacetylase family protein [Maricaulaceae bacterium]
MVVALAVLGVAALILVFAPNTAQIADGPHVPVLRSAPGDLARAQAFALDPDRAELRLRPGGPLKIQARFSAPPQLPLEPGAAVPVSQAAPVAETRAGRSLGSTPALRRTAAPPAQRVVIGSLSPNPRFPPAPHLTAPWRTDAARFVDDGRPLLAIVIDDIGPDRAGTERAQRLPREITFAILPYARSAAAIVKTARAADREVLVHMPMEPRGLDDPGPNAVRVGLSSQDIAQRVRWAFARVPGAVGLNNHMGSRATADPAAMRALADALAKHDRLFLDSVTTGASVALSAAEQAGVDGLARDIFLDHDPKRSAVARKLADATAAARASGAAVAIGHPRRASLDALEAWLSTEDAQTVRLAPLSAVWARRRAERQPGLLAQIR